MATKKIEDRKAKDKKARREQIIGAARQIAEAEGWPSVTVRRLADEISYSQPVLYSHFRNREEIVSVIAIEGFGELGQALEVARQQQGCDQPLEAVAAAYLDFAAQSPSLYDAMFSQRLDIPFDDPATPPQLRFAFLQIFVLFEAHGKAAPVLAEVFWANLHGIAELTRTGRFPPLRRKERLQTLIDVFSGAAN